MTKITFNRELIRTNKLGLSWLAIASTVVFCLSCCNCPFLSGMWNIKRKEHIDIPFEISKIVRGHSSDPHFLDRNCLNSQFPYISWGKSKRSFMILYVNVSDHFLER